MQIEASSDSGDLATTKIVSILSSAVASRSWLEERL